MTDVDTAVRAIGDRTSNAQLMVDCRDLGYLNETSYVVDVTYGLGRFWKLWEPPMLLGTDIDPNKSPAGVSVDFRDTGYLPGEFDTVVFDPPYKFSGTSRVSSDPGYGIGAYMSPNDRMTMIFQGVTEASRIVKPGGYVLVKCQDQVVSGKVVWQTHSIVEFARRLSVALVLQDMLHVVSYRPQPAGTRQLHARRDYSTLLVFKKEGKQ